MDEITEQLACNINISQDQNSSLSSANPRYLQYKTRHTNSSQENRRLETLKKQKTQRFDYINHLRKLAENDWQEMDTSDYNEQNDSASSDCENPKPGRFYKNQLMLSEWMLEVPPSFEKNWILLPCPVGRRTLVVASKGLTKSYSKNGYCTQSFLSELPGGNKAKSGWAKAHTIMDCIYCEITRTFYILDLMSWNNYPILESENEFRRFWLSSQINDGPDLTIISKTNERQFQMVSHVSCTSEDIIQLLQSYKDPKKLDGLLFYHKFANYVFGQTPLVLWLKAYMVPEILKVPVPQAFLELKPSSYSSFEKHSSEVKEDKEKSEHRRSLSPSYKSRRNCSKMDVTVNVKDG